MQQKRFPDTLAETEGFHPIVVQFLNCFIWLVIQNFPLASDYSNFCHLSVYFNPTQQIFINYLLCRCYFCPARKIIKVKWYYQYILSIPWLWYFLGDLPMGGSCSFILIAVRNWFESLTNCMAFLISVNHWFDIFQ